MTPVGLAQFPWLTTADTKFGEPGDYKTNLVIKKDDCKDVIKSIDKAIQESLTLAKEKSKSKQIKQASLPYHDELDEKGDPTGNVVFKFKCKAVVTPATPPPTMATLVLLFIYISLCIIGMLLY